MTITREGTLGPPRLSAGARDALDTVKKCIVNFGVFSAVVLTTVAGLAVARVETSSFMWIRAGILLLATPVLYRLAREAGQGVRRSFDRLRTVSLVLPIAIVVVDLIPGVCPVWYATIQAASAVPLIAIAVITRRRAVAAPFSADV